jgi:hypothetical protein
VAGAENRVYATDGKVAIRLFFTAHTTAIMASFNPTQIFDDGTTEEKGENARLSAFVGAIAVGDLGI